MATQVKFYSTATYSDGQNAGGIYFVGGPKDGELYRGTTRFGAGRVTEVADTTAMNALTGAIRGDIAVCAQGGAFAYDGTKWVAIGPDLAAVRTSWIKDIKASIADLDVELMGQLESDALTKIVVGVSETDGKVKAEVVDFPTLTMGDKDGQVKLNGVNASVSGWAELVADKDDLESRVKAIESHVDHANSKITADTAEFKNLTVSELATFSATQVSASELIVKEEDKATFGGLTISAIADREAAAKIAAIPETLKEATGANVVTVSVTTKAGSVDKVEVGVQKATVIGADGDASDDKLATEKAVRDALNSFDNAMHFKGVVSTLPTEGMEAGDIVVVGTPAEGSDLVSGQEYVYDGENWEVIGDQNALADLVTYTGYDTELTTEAQTLAGGINELDAKIKGMDADITSEEDNGVKVQVTEVDGVVTSVVTTVDAIEDADDIVTGEDKVVTAGAVADKIAAIVDDLDAEQDSNVEEDNAKYVDNKSIKVTLKEEDGKITGLGADLLWLGADGNVLGGETGPKPLAVSKDGKVKIMSMDERIEGAALFTITGENVGFSSAEGSNRGIMGANTEINGVGLDWYCGSEFEDSTTQSFMPAFEDMSAIASGIYQVTMWFNRDGYGDEMESIPVPGITIVVP